ncbi:EAL domain-containing protein [Thalassolituus sp. LLYu03]|uniref:bifunctional diguanylate cyclase/phosphodiesterase n=1 Tax=Thalassolituus sp. LLYu03 TaxID=3421656 RepID=UPI003D2A7CA6
MINMLRAQTLRRKLLIIVLIITGLTLVSSNMAFISLEYYLARQDVQKKMAVLGEVIAGRATAALTFSDYDLLTTNLNTLKADSSVIRGCIYADPQTLAASYIAGDETQPCPKQLHILQTNSNVNFSQFFPILLDETPIGTLYIEISHKDLMQRISQFLIFSGLILLAAVILSVLLATRLQEVVARPMRDLSNTLRHIMLRKDYSIRADKENHDELGDLVDLFNGLLRTVEEENASLKTSEERFRKLTALSPVGIFQVDPKQRLQYVNQRWRDIHGVQDEMPGLQEWFARIHPDDLAATQQAWNRLVCEQESVALELRLLRRDQSPIWIQLLASALHDRNGELLGYLGAISDISELKAAQIQMETLAFYDPLTGLANRRLFRNRLEKAVKSVLRSGSSMALMFLDMDQFKRVNDTLGHDAGDILLKEVANRLSNTVRENDTVSRIGGDEFTILLTDVHHTSDVLVVAEKLLYAMAKPIRIKGQDIVTTVSIGITLTPEDSTDANTLMKNADLAMYRAKELGRNNFQFFSEDMNHSILEHLSLEKEINEAIARQQFSLVFQPKISLFDFGITGVETLIRWQHPEKGMITPDRFIPVAEETGQILEIGSWVLEQSCRQISSLIRSRVLPANAKVAVNLSARQFTDPYLLQRIRNVLEITAIPPQCLELEITESTLMEDVESAIQIMQEIKKTGVTIAIDDFGTGYSSLAYIKRFPIDVLKVDRSFVMDIPGDKNDMAITAAVIAMAHKLSLTVVAEGVETQEQLQFLRQNNCDEGQGYLFSRPLSLGQLHQFLSESDRLRESDTRQVQ